VLAASRGESTQLTVLVRGLGDPLHAGVVANSVVLRIDQDDLVVLVGQVLVHPVGVQHTEVAALASHTLLSDGAEVAGRLLLVDTLVLGLSIHDTLAVGPLASTTADGNTVDNKALLSLVAQPVGLLRTERAVHSVDLGELAVLPSADAQQKAHGVRLLLAPELLDVTVGSHFRVVYV